jgi:aminoglycoside phosphotransferase (APT) family kinase protein
VRHADWLVEHHSRWQTSSEVLNEAVRRAGFSIGDVHRIVVGQANEVYAVTAVSGEELIVRMAHRRDPKFASETAAIERVRAAGIPAPEVLVLWAPEREGAPTAVLVEQRLPGEMLRDLWRREPSTRCADELGELVARIHDIAVEGFGNLSPSLRGTHISYSEWFIDLWVSDHLPSALAAVEDDSSATAAVREAERQITSARQLLDHAESRLAHGDLSPTNVLVCDGRVTGIVDWEAVKGAPRSNDIAWWSSFVPDAIVEALLRGYRRHAPSIDELGELVRLSRLRILAGLLAYTRSVGDEESFRFATERLKTALQE